mmetsp:Transcript_11760/g.16802  ORF Transcript_11760/g.16802 Transcript_11760/m.16802 type:complete len:513 (+) Transcript_11760:146-1684(+)
MWATLRSDLKEFVSGVADETTNVVAGEEIDTAKLEATASNEVARLRNLDTTYLQTLGGDEDEGEDAGIKAFLQDFTIENNKDQIKSLLAEYPDSIKLYHEKFVPDSVDEKEFWGRYFYRCDEERIVERLRKEGEDKRQARAEAINAGINKVSHIVGGASNIVGGALTAVSKKLKSDDSAKSTSGTAFKFDAAKTSAKSLNIFGASGRPPFVMNTVVDDDDDDKKQNEEEEEEEELGWDDDDEFDADEDEHQQNTPVQLVDHAIEGSAGESALAIEKLRKDLQNAIAERDQLKTITDSQADQIATLREEKLQKEDTDELDHLKTILEDKNSQIAALRDSLKDVSGDDKDNAILSSLENEIHKLKEETSAKDEKLQAANKQVSELETKMSSLTTEVSNANNTLATLTEEASDYKKEIDQLKHLLAETKAAHESLMKEKESEFETKLKAELAKAKEISDALLKAKQAELATEINSEDSPTSFSTGVDVEEDVVPSEAVEIEEDDEWGDDGWGDDG